MSTPTKKLFKRRVGGPVDDDAAVTRELKDAHNVPRSKIADGSDSEHEMTYRMLPRNGGKDSVSVDVAGGGMAGLKKSGRTSPEGIPYADLGTMEVSAGKSVKEHKRRRPVDGR